MKPGTHSNWLLGLAVAAGCWFGGATVTLAQVDATTNAAAVKSPVDEFRELLVMPVDIRQKLLAKQTQQRQQRIAEKIREYAKMTSEEREARLLATELSWYLLPLLNAPATNRAQQIALLPPAKRPLVEPRLRQWDALASGFQQTLLTNRQAIAYLARPELTSPAAAAELIRAKLKSLTRLVELRAEEKKRLLSELPAAERQRMETTLRAFEKLPPGQRERCVQSFAAFAVLSETERQDFLKNAERWSQMSPAQRETWRAIVIRLPITPPGAGGTPARTNAG